MPSLYIMRHGEAQMHARDDAARELTEWGRRQVVNVSQSMKELKPRRLLVSPYVRAQQTAQIVVDQLGIEPSWDTCDQIIPNADPRAVVSLLDQQVEQHQGKQPLLMVSHNPLVSALSGLLLAGSLQQGLPFVTASVARLDFQVFGMGMGELIWIKHPD